MTLIITPTPTLNSNTGLDLYETLFNHANTVLKEKGIPYLKLNSMVKD